MVDSVFIYPLSELTYPIPFGTFESIIFQGSKVGYMLVPFPGGFTDFLEIHGLAFSVQQSVGQVVFFPIFKDFEGSLLD